MFISSNIVSDPFLPKISYICTTYIVFIFLSKFSNPYYILLLVYYIYTILIVSVYLKFPIHFNSSSKFFYSTLFIYLNIKFLIHINIPSKFYYIYTSLFESFYLYFPIHIIFLLRLTTTILFLSFSFYLKFPIHVIFFISLAKHNNTAVIYEQCGNSEKEKIYEIGMERQRQK